MLNPILHKIISLKQGGNVEACQILDGIIVSHETIHSLKINKSLVMIMKLDMPKYYDRLN
jgi:hypothetical protein